MWKGEIENEKQKKEEYLQSVETWSRLGLDGDDDLEGDDVADRYKGSVQKPQ